MQVLARVRQHYKIDDSRIYLMGHSMGAIGTWKVAPKYPDVWAAIAHVLRQRRAGNARTDRDDARVHRPRRRRSDGQRRRLAGDGRQAEELGTEFKYLEVPGGLHGDVVAPNLAAMIDFFDAHRKGVKSSSQQ